MPPERLPLLLVLCLSGALWDLAAFPSWNRRVLRVGGLPYLGTLDAYVDYVVARWIRGLDAYALVGDSFGATVALALAAREPAGLRALVVSGGFARPHVSRWKRAKLLAGRALPYGALVSLHIVTLGSRFDPPGTRARLERALLTASDRATYFRRADPVSSTDLRPALARVRVPTRVLTPEVDRLIGPAAALELVEGLLNATETVRAGTGHLLRFTHADAYAHAVDAFLAPNDVCMVDAPRSVA